jgi:hypothetical protein
LLSKFYIVLMRKLHTFRGFRTNFGHFRTDLVTLNLAVEANEFGLFARVFDSVCQT